MALFPDVTSLQRFVTQRPWEFDFLQDLIERYSPSTRPEGFANTVDPLQSLNHTCVFSALSNNPASMHYDYVVFLQAWPITQCLSRLMQREYCNVYYLRRQAVDIVNMMTEKWELQQQQHQQEYGAGAQLETTMDENDVFMQENPFIVWGLRPEVQPGRRIRGQTTGPKCCIRPHIPGVIDLPNDVSSEALRLLPFGKPLQPQHGTELANRTSTAVIESKFYREREWPDLLYPRTLLEQYPNHGSILREWQKHGSCILYRNTTTTTTSDRSSKNHHLPSFDDYLQLINVLSQRFNLTDESPRSPISLLQSTGIDTRINVTAAAEQIRDHFKLPSLPQMYCVDLPGLPHRVIYGVGVCLDKDIAVERDPASGVLQNVVVNTVPCPSRMQSYLHTADKTYRHHQPRLCSASSLDGDDRDQWAVLPGIDALNPFHALQDGTLIELDRSDPDIDYSLDVLDEHDAERLVQRRTSDP